MFNNDALMIARHFTEHAGAPRYFYFLEAESWDKFQEPTSQ